MSAARTAVTGSIATDHLMHFPGRFTEQFVGTALDHISLSFLVDDLVIRRGGVGANIAFGMGVLGQSPVLVGAVGADFAEYRDWLEGHGVNCAGVLVVPTGHTPRFTCTTDDDQCQLASFYPGAKSHARHISPAPIVAEHNIDLILVGANDPEAMIAHTEQARAMGVAFAADPSQQLPRLDRRQCRGLVEGARFLFGNEYEWELLTRATGWTETQIRDRLELWITTLAERGVRIVGRDGTEPHVDALPARAVTDPTGGGDTFRAGFLAGLRAELTVQRAAQLGALLATRVLETPGTRNGHWTAPATPSSTGCARPTAPPAAAEIAPILAKARTQELVA
jgi:adenosine kinase